MKKGLGIGAIVVGVALATVGAYELINTNSKKYCKCTCNRKEMIDDDDDEKDFKAIGD